MVRNLRLALPTAAAAFALMTVPPLLPAPMTAGLSGSALAAVKLNTSRSNIYRTKQTGKPKQTTGAAQATTIRGTKSNSSERIGRGYGAARPSAGAAQATTIRGTKSNQSERIGRGYGAARPSAGAAQATTVSGTKSNQSDRIGRGYGTARPSAGAAQATTINSSKSNQSERMRSPGIGSSR